MYPSIFNCISIIESGVLVTLFILLNFRYSYDLIGILLISKFEIFTCVSSIFWFKLLYNCNLILLYGDGFVEFPLGYESPSLRVTLNSKYFKVVVKYKLSKSVISY